MTLPVPDFPSPTDLIKAAELATNAGDPALALHFLKTASAAANTLGVVAAAPAGAVKPIEEPSVVQPLIPDPPNFNKTVGEIVHIAVCRHLQCQQLGYCFTFHQIAQILKSDDSLSLQEDRYLHKGARVLWRRSLSRCLDTLRKENIIRKGGGHTEYVLLVHPLTTNPEARP